MTSFDNENPVSSAAAAPAQEVESPNKPEENATAEVSEGGHGTVVPQEPAHVEPVKVEDAHKAAEAHAQTAAADAEAAAAAEEAAGAEEMSKLIEQYSEPQEVAAQNEIIEVKVVAYTEHGVVVDLGGKTEGLIPAAEFQESDIPRPDPSSTIEVQRTGEHKDSFVIVSYQKVLRRRTWEKIDAQFKAKETISAKVVDRIKGGLVVDIGVRAFLPGSQYDLRPTANLDGLIGTNVDVRITKLNRRRGNVVVSRRALLEETLHAKRAELMEQLKEGQTVHGTVKNVTDYGAFVDIGGLDGLLHLTDLSWGRVRHPSDVVKPEQELDVVVLKFDKDKQRVSLGLKQLMKDPWIDAAERYPAGGKYKGKVVGVVDYGAFVELEPGIEGLVHVTEMSWAKKPTHPSKVVKAGEEVDVVVLDIKPSDRRVSLGIKQAQPDPWLLVAEKYPVGTVVTGKVRNIAEFGAFIEIEDGFDGLVHVSDVSWTGRVKNPHEVFKKGEPITAKVLRIDPENRRVSLGMKQVNDIWGDWFKSHRIGDVVRGKVSRIATFGAFVELGDNIEGLCHNTEIEERKRRDEGPSSFRPTTGPLKSAGPLEPGKDYDFKIIKISHDTRRIGLSYRAAVRQQERREIEQYKTSKSSSTATIGDALKQKLSSR
ncbi:MAG TPA: 30S ribosomal protein S1 [Candidatus Acidoferrales bacterium]|jgi:small subunit ribosomal protein S1|nr:30S ribosomal protein S1 [Candidatus Acidoferrales bacterium]